jgi:hypothetical protein
MLSPEVKAIELTDKEALVLLIRRRRTTGLREESRTA